jgi:cell volume regulation protein A
MSAQDVIGTVALMLAVGLVAELAAAIVRLPRMILLLAAGAALGPHALGVLDVPLDSIGASILFALGVSVILFYGGLELSLGVLSRVGIALGLLAVPGVFITALVAGTVAALVFGIPFEAGFLIGAVLAPSDPAILIPLFERLRIRPKIAQTVVAESALNDVTGAVLTLSVASFVIQGEGSLADPLAEFALELVISTGLGLLIGVALALAISSRRVGIWRETAALGALVGVGASYFAIESAGGSGYMGAFVAGLIVGNMNSLRLGIHPEHEQDVHSFMDLAKEVAVILVFVTLGVNLPFDRMAEHAVPALVVLAAFIFVARPLTVLACLLPDRRGRWESREIAFVAWTRETGVVPAALVGVLVARGVPYGDEIVTVVALAVIVTLVVQSTTKPWLARRLGLLEQ